MLDAKTYLSRLAEEVLRGEEEIIANRGKPVVQLVLAEPAKPERNWGALAGLWSEAEIDAAFAPQADLEAAADLLCIVHRRGLQAVEPAASCKPIPSVPKAIPVKANPRLKKP